MVGLRHFALMVRTGHSAFLVGAGLPVLAGQ